jgi:hypothetical protein
MRQRGDQAEGDYVNKKVLLAFAAAIAVTACVSQSPATYTAVSGSKADARITVDYRAQAFRGRPNSRNGMDAPAFNGISCAKVDVSSNHLNQRERPG